VRRILAQLVLVEKHCQHLGCFGWWSLAGDKSGQGEKTKGTTKAIKSEDGEVMREEDMNLQLATQGVF
jgi:hypothetical protein